MTKKKMEEKELVQEKTAQKCDPNFSCRNAFPMRTSGDVLKIISTLINLTPNQMPGTVPFFYMH